MKNVPVTALIFCTLLCACSKEKNEKVKKGTSGTATVAMVNESSQLLHEAFLVEEAATTYTPSSFGVKLLGVRLTQDKDGNDPVGVSPVIWANSACKTQTRETTVDEDDGEVQYGYTSYDGDCTDAMVSTYFELARSSAAINAELNAQALVVMPGTYKYVTLDFCQNGPTTNNVSFVAPGMSSAAQIQIGTCGTNSVEANPPIVIGEGEAVVVSLTYSLEDIVYDYGPGMGKGANCYFNNDETVRRCINPPNIEPSFTKAE